MDKRYGFVIAMAIILFFIVGNYVFLQREDILAGKDAQPHTLICSDIYQNVMNGRFDIGQLYDKDWPRGFHVVAVAVRIIFSYSAIFMTPTLFFIMLLWSTYKIGTFLKDRTAGFISALIVSLYPAMYISSRHFDYEMAQAAMVALLIYLLLDIRRFSTLLYAVQFGLLMGFGLLVKQSIIFFISGPLLIILGYVAIKHDIRKIRNMCCGLISGACLAFVGYYRIYLDPNILIQCGVNRFLKTDLDGFALSDPYGWEQLTYYLRAMKDHYISIVGIVVFLIGLPFFIRFKDRRSQLIMYSWFVIPFCIFSVATLKSPHYAISFLPVFAIISAVGISFLRPKLIANVVLSIFIMWGAVSYLCCTFDIFPTAKAFLEESKLYIPQQWWGFFGPRQDNPIYETAASFDALAGKRSCMVGVLYYPGERGHDESEQTALEALVKLYSPHYVVTDLIGCYGDIEISNYNYFVYQRNVSRSEEWIYYDAFVAALAHNYQNEVFPQATRYMLDNQMDWSGKGNITVVPAARVQDIADYVSRLQLMKVICGKITEWFIYRNKNF